MRIFNIRLLFALLMISGLTALEPGWRHDNFESDVRYLSSEQCFGRSYAENGIRHAERHIAGQLKNAGIKTRKQTLRYKINVCTETPLCIVNGDTLRPAYDFIPHPYSASYEGVFSQGDIRTLNAETLKDMQDSLDLFSASAVRRFLIAEAAENADERLLLFPEENILQSKQNKHYKAAGLQIRGDVLPDSLETIFVRNQTTYKNIRCKNIIAYVRGTRDCDSLIMLTAHYDHMGALGDIWYPGANDNGSGVAVLLALARHYAQNPPPCPLVFCFLSGEEQGLLGAEHYAENPPYELSRVMSLVNLDMVGSGKKGYGMVNGAACPKEAAILQGICLENEFGELRIRDNSPNSDHYPFTERGVPAFFLYSSGGEQPYHHPDDIPTTLDYEALENTFMLVREFIDARSQKAAGC